MSTAASKPRLSVGWVVAIALIQAAWLVWFLVEPLPSAGDSGIRRFDLLMRALPAVVPGVRWDDSYLGMACSNLSHFANLSQRGPIALSSLFIAGAALAVGSMILRGLGLRAGSRFERVALGFGLGTTALGVGTLLAGRTIGLDPAVARVSLAGLIVAGVGVEVWVRLRKPGRSGGRESIPRRSIGQVLSFVAVAGPFLVMMGLGAMLPTIEFDALEYHLQGPKEFYLDGRIAFLPHNVYASMPFGVEMLHLLGMLVVGDWWLGALAGQELVAWFAPASAVLIGSTAARVGGSARAGWFAALIYLTTPWIFRVAASPFVEGPLCFFHAALVWAVVRFGWLGGKVSEGSKPSPVASGVLVGLLAGGAMAIKYPALISAVIPASLVVLIEARRTRSSRLIAGFAVGLGLVVSPWLGKNVVDTGNPVYPLAWSVFGGSEWDAGREAQWQAAHGAKPVRLDLFARSVLDAAGRSDWQSPLYAALAPLAWLGLTGRRTASALAIYSAYLFATWWLLTHRLDRFWLPMLPPLAVLAGLGADAFAATSRMAFGWLVIVLALAIGSNATLCSTELSGPTAWTGDLAAVRDETARSGTPSLARLDSALPPGARPLLIGQAGAFGLRHRPVYNTVFNRDTFESLARDKSPEQIRAALTDRGITHVFVDWSEIDRYRKPGNYGFSDFETPELFAKMVESGVLGPAVRLGSKQILYEVQPIRQ